MISTSKNEKKKPPLNFIIFSPRQIAGGPIVLHLLCKLLTEHGFGAKIFYSSIPIKYTKEGTYWKHFWTYWLIDIIKSILVKILPKTYFEGKQRYSGYVYEPVKGCKRVFFPIINREKYIIIYPEGIYGNPLKCKYVVRWLLYHNKYKDDYNCFSQKDLIITFREVFNDSYWNPEKKTVTLNSFDKDLYKQTNFNERKGRCYIVRKGKNRTDLPKEFDGIVIDNLSEEEKVRVFNECLECISYDMQTFYTTIAALCGCKVRCVLEEGKKKSDYLSEDEKVYGVAYGDSEDELQYAEKTRELVNNKIKQFDVNNENNLNKFINYVTEWLEENDFDRNDNI